MRIKEYSSHDSGKAIARRSARSGPRVQFVARGREELEARRAELLEFTQEVRATALDLPIPDSARQIVGGVRTAWRGLDILVTNVRGCRAGRFSRARRRRMIGQN